MYTPIFSFPFNRWTLTLHSVFVVFQSLWPTGSLAHTETAISKLTHLSLPGQDELKFLLQFVSKARPDLWCLVNSISSLLSVWSMNGSVGSSWGEDITWEKGCRMAMYNTIQFKYSYYWTSKKPENLDIFNNPWMPTRCPRQNVKNVYILGK